MSTWYNAQRNIVEAANQAMAEIVGSFTNEDPYELRERFNDAWGPVADALLERYETAEPSEDEQALAEEQGGDFVGMTNERDIVAWGAEIAVPGHGFSYRPFVIVDRHESE